MFPLILLALGLGAFAAYSFSPHVRSRVDDYVRAIRGAHEAHRAADDHLYHAPKAEIDEQHTRLSMDRRGVDHAIAATLANERAAQSTVEAARIAQTGAERSAVADSAARVLERGKRIKEAMVKLGVGQCGVRSYEHVTLQIRDDILRKLHAEGMTVTGDDPWDIDTQLAGVKLRAVWDPERGVLKLIVTASSLFAPPCEVIWQRIEGALRGIVGS